MSSTSSGAAVRRPPRRTAGRGRTRSRAGSPSRRRRRRPVPQGQGHVDAGGDPRGGDDLAVLDHPRVDGLGAVRAERLAIDPVAGGALALEEAGGAEHQRAGADRRRPGRGLVRGAQPVEHLVVAEQRPVALATRHEHDRGREGQRGRADAGGARVGALRAGLLGDEAQVRVRKAREDLVGADGVQRRELVEDQDRDSHRHVDRSAADRLAALDEARARGDGPDAGRRDAGAREGPALSTRRARGPRSRSRSPC